MSAAPAVPGRFGATLLLVFLGYLLLALGAVWLARQPGTIATLWYANAFGITFLWAQPLRRWPALLGVMLVANMLAGQLMGDTLAMSASFLPANMLEMALAAFLLRRTGVALNMSRSPSAFLRFILLGAMVPPLVSSTLGALIVQSIGYAGFGRVWLSWYEGAVLGTLSILPLTVQLQQHGLHSLRSPRRPHELFFYVPLVLLVTLVALRLLPSPFVYLSLPLLLAAVRLPFAGTALLVTLTSFSGGLMVAMGGLELPPVTPLWQEVTLYLPLLLSLLPPLLLAAAVEQGRRRQRELAASEARFRDAMEHSAIGMALVGLDGRWQRVNRALCEMLGYTPAEFMGLTFQDITHPDDLADDLELVREMLEGRRDSYRLEKRYQRRDGSQVWALLAVSLVRDGEGRPLYFISQIEDIDRRKRAEAELAELAQRYSLATGASGVGVWDWDLISDDMIWDDSLFRLYGLRPLGRPVSYEEWVRFVHPGDIDAMQRELQRVREGLVQLDVEFRITLPNGDIRTLRGHGSLALDAEGKPTRMIGTNWDVTQLRELTERLNDERERLQVTLNSIGDGVITTDLDGRVRFLNPVAERLSGWSTAAARGQAIERVLPLESEEGRPVASPVRPCLELGTVESIPGLSSLRHGAGGLIALRGQAAPVRSADGELLGSVLVFTDVSEARAMQKHLRYAATHDALTGLLNRPAFEDALAESCREVEQNAGHSVLFFIDLDHFKQVNDNAGHAAGDELLRRISRLMQDLVRSGDLLARLGGDEFSMILRSCPLAQAEILAARLIEHIQALRFEWEGQVFQVGASVGLATLRAGNSEPAELLRQADIACYQAKNGGRGRLAVYAEALAHG
ncbi:PAS domain S-box protein [Pseudomonas sp. PDM13]|uniref:PAS domain S-box protein n=1 Tax=Pseudomonas sp. PDM13 TaxID=2769255 RepID=UPI0021DFA62B|nr:PAS domain S-box protein [Pseudomonas sp. PDM13]MCU9951059.1 PAS domain S-box protein [Pseudomonas sp. PDM13]